MNIVFLSSAGGYTFEYALAAQQLGVIGGKVIKVITDRACRTEDVAREYGVPHERVKTYKGQNREEYTQNLLAAIPTNTDLVCISLMKLIGEELLNRFPNRVINTHPSLLPAYKGYGANRKMLTEGKTVFGGCSLHLVDSEMDNGAIIIQSVIPLDLSITQSDWELAVWHHQKKNFSQTLHWYFEDRVIMNENRVIVLDAHYGLLPTNPSLELSFGPVDEYFKEKHRKNQ